MKGKLEEEPSLINITDPKLLPGLKTVVIWKSKEEISQVAKIIHTEVVLR